MTTADTYVVERRRHVDAPRERVRERIVDFHRWTSWSPWEGIDPNLDRTYKGAPEGVGAVYEWDGNRKAGRGTMEITAADESTVTIDLRFLKPFKSHSTATFELEDEEGGTNVTWRMIGPKTLMTKVMGLFTSMDKMIGPDFDKGLDQLKADAER